MTRARRSPAPPVSRPETEGSVRQDTVTLTLLCAGGRWHTHVTLGTVSHDLGPQPTASAAMNAAMAFYYQQRPPSRRRGPLGSAE